MGTPAFPDLGKHCTVEECKQIDFLPFTCDRCNLVYCLDHRSYIKHNCKVADKKDVNVVVCPICAKGVRLIPEEDPNITWERHINTDCDPSNYEKVTKKKKCPVQGCREVLTFSNTIKCKECTTDHCLKHRFGPDHNCPGPKKSDSAFSFIGAFRSKNDASKTNQATSTSSKWSFFTDVLGNDLSRALQLSKDSSSSRGKGNTEQRVRKVTIDVCPKCSKGFRDPVALVEHVERDHGGTSRA